MLPAAVEVVGVLMRRVVLQLVATAALLLVYHVPPIDFSSGGGSDYSTPAAAQSQGLCVSTGTSCVALNPQVTAETSATTICISHFTEGLRPGAHYVSDMKIQLGRKAGLSPEAAETMILDHIVPLALGGHPRDPSNLQLQEAAESYRKDRIEKKLQCLVCAGQVTLSEARAAIATDWQAAYHRFAHVKCHRTNKVRVTEAPTAN